MAKEYMEKTLSKKDLLVMLFIGLAMDNQKT